MMPLQSPLSPSKEQFIVRFPAGMRERLKQIAAENRRSMNAELLLLIERGLGLSEHSAAGQRADGGRQNMA
jgi:hypothetical protein